MSVSVERNVVCYENNGWVRCKGGGKKMITGRGKIEGGSNACHGGACGIGQT